MSTLLARRGARQYDKILPGRRELRNLNGNLDSEHQTMKTEILATHTAALFKAAVVRAVALLEAGEVVALPTETVYGLAANALDAQAVGKIYEIKGRPLRNPIITHVADLEVARECVSHWPAAAEKLARSFWPGPLTMVLRRSKKIPDIVTAGGPTIGLRWPSHPFIQAVIRECGFPLAAPSANLSNQISPTNAAHVSKDLGGKINLIVDGGQSQVGIESTVLDLTTEPLEVLRPGMIHAESLKATLESGGDVAIREKRESIGGALRSPGRLPRHYSPKAKLELWAWRDTQDLATRVAKQGWQITKVHVIAHTVIPGDGAFGRVSVIPHDAEAFARAIYAELHTLR